MQNMLRSYSDGPGSGDIGGNLDASLDASLESFSAVVPASASYASRAYVPHSALAQEEQDQPPEYDYVAAGPVDTKGDGKTGLPSSHVGEKEAMEKEWQSATLQPDSRMTTTASLMPTTDLYPFYSADDASPSSAQPASSSTMARSNTRSGASGVKLHSSDKGATFDRK